MKNTESETTQTMQKMPWLNVFIAVTVAVAAFIGWRFSQSPLPSHFEKASGVITESKIVRRAGICFTIEGVPYEFCYRTILPDFERAKLVIIPGNTATVDYTNTEKVELWNLTVNGQSVIDRNAVHKANTENGRAALWVFIAFSASAAFLTWYYRAETLASSNPDTGASNDTKE